VPPNRLRRSATDSGRWLGEVTVKSSDRVWTSQDAGHHDRRRTDLRVWATLRRARTNRRLSGDSRLGGGGTWTNLMSTSIPLTDTAVPGHRGWIAEAPDEGSRCRAPSATGAALTGHAALPMRESRISVSFHPRPHASTWHSHRRLTVQNVFLVSSRGVQPRRSLRERRTTSASGSVVCDGKRHTYRDGEAGEPLAHHPRRPGRRTRRPSDLRLQLGPSGSRPCGPCSSCGRVGQHQAIATSRTSSGTCSTIADLVALVFQREFAPGSPACDGSRCSATPS
jgi:hypothetical protein